MPDITITPISSRDGACIFGNNQTIGDRSWSMRINVETERIKHHGIPKDARDLRWSLLVDGFASGDGTIESNFDAADPQTDKGIWIGQSGTAWLGYDDEFGFIIDYYIDGLQPTSNTANPGGSMYSWTFQVLAADFSSDGP